MFKKLISKYYFYVMGALTAVALWVLTVFSTAEDVLEAMIENPMPIILAFLLMVIWAVLLLVSSVVLLFSAEKREKLFLLTTHTEVRDELEEKATSDAIKQAFFFNIVLLTFLFSISGVYKMVDQSGAVSYGYSIAANLHETVDVDGVMTLLDKHIENKIENAPAEKLEEMKTVLAKASTDTKLKLNSMLDENNQARYIMPKSVYSPYGVIWFILLQFITFKTFLFLNLRALSSEAD